MLQNYFRSGWAFLLPYLSVYLLYAWLKWPVNPAAGGEGIVNGMSESDGASFMLPAPCSLLHLYWLLHAAHLVLAAIAFTSWWRDRRRSALWRSDRGEAGFSVLWPLAPWLCLALFFWIPGVYLEWPSDPWEHLRRINEWHILDQVTAHSSWKKSSYFLPYSLTGHTTGLDQLSWLNFYYTGLCLLLSWQYFRLAQAVSLGERASFIFVLLNALTFGNNIFSFYRYYGLSSSILAQLGAVALTRITLEALRPREMQGAVSKEQWAQSILHSPFSVFNRFPRLPSLSPVGLAKDDLVSRLPQLGGAGFFLLPLIALNHIQGLGIAGLGVLAVVVWRLIEWKRSMAIWLPLTAVLASVAVVLWFPRHPALDAVYRTQGWLTTFHGINLFSFSSPALERSLKIVGIFGLLDLALGLWLIVRKNHVVGWQTLMPLLALCFPCFALPLAYFVTADHPSDDIVIFHRLLLAMPVALATVAALSRPWLSERSSTLGYIYAVGALSLALTLSSTGPAYNRFWHGIQISPNDLDLRAWIAPQISALPTSAKGNDTLFITPPLGRRVQEAFAPQREWWPWRQVYAPPNVAELERTLGWVQALPSSATPLPSASSPGETLFMIPFQAPPDVIDLASPGAAWVDDRGSSPEIFSSAEGLIINYSSGAATPVFSKKCFRLDLGKRYQLAITIRQSGAPQAINYLAVAWLGKDGKLLMSNDTVPSGAGNPIGWANGTYSYFGLAAQPAPATWTTYSVSFGLGEPAEIPAHAAFLRVGALLNYQGTPHANIQLKQVQLREKPLPERVIFFAPDLVTPASVAAQLSQHWNPAKVHIDYTGTVELRTATSRGSRN